MANTNSGSDLLERLKGYGLVDENAESEAKIASAQSESDADAETEKTASWEEMVEELNKEAAAMDAGLDGDSSEEDPENESFEDDEDDDDAEESDDSDDEDDEDDEDASDKEAAKKPNPFLEGIKAKEKEEESSDSDDSGDSDDEDSEKDSGKKKDKDSGDEKKASWDFVVAEPIEPLSKTAQRIETLLTEIPLLGVAAQADSAAHAKEAAAGKANPFL